MRKVVHLFAVDEDADVTPYPVLLVLGGLGIGFIPGLPAVALEPDVVFLLFLPPILFGAGYFTSIRDSKRALSNVA